MNLTTEEKGELVRAAWSSIKSGLGLGAFPLQTISALSRPGASFVTLHTGDALRGCMGTLEADEPIFSDVTRNAAAAAFHDPRFARLSADELPSLSLSVSVLSTFEQIVFSSEEDLIRQLVPGTTGLVLFLGNKRATFLPSVWEMLPEPADFVRRLKHKAGLPDGPVGDLQALRYTTTSFG